MLKRPGGARGGFGFLVAAGVLSAGSAAVIGCGGGTGANGAADAGVCLTAWPMPNAPTTGLPHPQSYDTGNAAWVEDKVTGLIWQRALDAGGFNWTDAHTYCTGLTLAGTSGWRLPRVVELVSIVDLTRAMPAIDPDAFPGTPNLPFWTSETDVTNQGLAWYVFFRNGGAYGGNDIADVQQVRCVRGPDAASVASPGGCYTIAGGIVRDTRTTLGWQQALDPASYTWVEAQAVCAALDLDGGGGGAGGGWRLPSLNELMTIVDFGRVDPAIDPAIFPDTSSDLFWSSSPATGSSTTAWGVNFTRGSSGAAPIEFPSRVRCVK